MKCKYCKEGDSKFNHEFKNQTMLDMHIKHKHKAAEPDTIVHNGIEPPKTAHKGVDFQAAPPAAPPADPGLSDLGIGGNEEPEPEKNVLYCSECGFEIDVSGGNPEKCPNCGEVFGSG